MSHLAIVIPYYKHDFFEETLKSVAMQTNKCFTLYIGNDASPHNPLPIIRQHFPKDDYHYFDYKENLGGKNLAMQWERILENVTEEWFQILGDDDIIPNDFVERFYHTIELAEKERISVLKYPHIWISETGAVTHTFPKLPQKLAPADFLVKKLKGEITGSLSENIFRTTKYFKYRFEKLPLAWGSDDIAVFIFAEGKSILFINGEPVKVRVSENSISGSDLHTTLKSHALREQKHLIITKYKNALPTKDKEILTDAYLIECHLQKSPADYAVANIYLPSFRFTKFVKTLKRIYYLNKMYA